MTVCEGHYTSGMGDDVGQRQYGAWALALFPLEACETEAIKNRLLHCLHVTCTTVFVHFLHVAIYICMYLPPEGDLIGQSVQG